MSLILDALRKLSREKSVRRNGTVNIAAEILRPDPPPRRRRTWVYLTALFLTAVATAAITYTVMSKAPPRVALSPSASRLHVAPAPISPKPLLGARERTIPEPAKTKAGTEKKRPVERERPVEAKKPEELRKPQQIQEPEEVKKTEAIKKPEENKKLPVEEKIPAPPPIEEKRSPQVVSKEAPVVPADMKKPAEKAPAKSSLTPESLRLSGIVWSEDASKRLAVINGMVTTEGYVFEGMKVMEIHPDRVLLLLNDKPLELSLNR